MVFCSGISNYLVGFVETGVCEIVIGAGLRRETYRLFGDGAVGSGHLHLLSLGLLRFESHFE